MIFFNINTISIMSFIFQSVKCFEVLNLICFFFISAFIYTVSKTSLYRDMFFLIILLGVFTLYHINVVLTNRTTNERYKAAELEPMKNPDTNRQGKKLNLYSTCNIYNKGIFGNLYDTFWQRSIVRSKILR